ncbi:MAG: glycosyltransferase family 4 protein [Clostridiales bacterium]|nr:glycosyltransferase family 4 protein [Clostridiales bacterium]MCC8107014.1 glycosyltransferase family 4 protein [Clostridiales bacterium]
MKRIAFINQRYGLEVNGGSEYYTRLMAEHLAGRYEVEILTTKAVDYVTWSNYYKNDEEEIQGIRVRRFPVTRERNMEVFGRVNTELLTSDHRSSQDEMRWIEEQGPVCPALIEYIGQNRDNYDVFIFVTYLYYTTCMGILRVPEKSILIPTAHDEPYIYFNYYKKVFHAPQAIIFLTEEEREFVHGLFHNQQIPNDVMAVGIDVPQQVEAAKFKEKYHLEDYIVYVGRIDESKGCRVLFNYFIEYKKRNHNSLKLVLMGKPVLEIPSHPDIISLGFVSEEDKFNGIKGAKTLILPSAFESLSIAILEAMAINVPVIVNGDCEVLKGHCVRSNAGLYYTNYFEFEGCLNYMFSHEEDYSVMCRNAKQYVERDFVWDVVLDKFSKVIEEWF